MSELATKIDNCLRTQLPFAPDGTIDPAADLRDYGLDSMSAIDLLLSVETTFDIRFPDALIGAETFRTATTLAAAIKKLQE